LTAKTINHCLIDGGFNDGYFLASNLVDIERSIVQQQSFAQSAEKTLKSS
jgi:hypothetical protein